MRILTRYVLLDLTKTFLACLTGLTMMFLLIGVFREAANQNLPLGAVTRLIPYLLPDVLRITVPVTLLLAATLVYGRMSGANEVVAAKALGISPVALLWPILILGFLLSLTSVWLNDLAVSWGRSGVQRVAVTSLEEIIYSMLEAQHRYSTPFFSINVKQVEKKRLLRPTVSIQGRGNSPTITILAEEAELHVEFRPDQPDGVLRLILRNGTLDVQGHLTFNFPDTYEREISLKDASRAGDAGGQPSWDSLRVIPEKIARQQQRIQRCEQEIAARAAYQMLTGDFDDLTGSQWDAHALRLKTEWSYLYRLQTEPHRRWSAGFSCLCFVWVGAPMAIWLRNRDYLTSFFLCFLPILIVYYPLLASAVDGAKNGNVPPYAVWGGNVMLAIWGAYLLRKVVRY